MGKEDVSAKKRRKINTSSSSDTSKPVPVDIYKVNILLFEKGYILKRSIIMDLLTFLYVILILYFFLLQRVVEFEESEAQLRPAEKDATLFKKICQDIRHLFAEISELKAKDTDEVKYGILIFILTHL